MTPNRLLAFGCGYVATALAHSLAGRDVPSTGTARTAGAAEALARQGIDPVIWPGDPFAPPPGSAWLISVPPDEDGCPVCRSFGSNAEQASWIGYLSTTGVYGDLDGGWAFEETPRNPLSREAVNRARAEDQWLAAGAQVFRLPGIYGPGRSQLDRVRQPGARRIIKPGQVFSRAHRDDIAAALEASIARPDPGRIYNICDDEPAPADEVLAYAARLLGLDPPPAVAFEEAGLSPAAQRFYAECKRVSNARAKAQLGWTPRFPTYREGLAAIRQAETAST
ncbi:MAG: SDR family NAD(P)-dependent oxidoreductase [Alphaproteobacteria bacterium]|nr:SDR family NAD(P)-dependent oxidoreductase [Alphaproteobacteria bacterium]